MCTTMEPHTCQLAQRHRGEIDTTNRLDIYEYIITITFNAIIIIFTIFDTLITFVETKRACQ